MTCVRGRLDASSGADDDGAAELAPRSTALSRLGASAHAHVIEPLPGGPSRACPPSRDPSPQGQRIPRRRAQRWTGPLPPRVTSPQQPRSLHAEKSPNGTASENLGASRKPPPAFWPPSHLERRRTSAPRTRLSWNSQSAGATQTLRAVRKSRLVDLTSSPFSCGAGSPTRRTTKAGAGPVRCNGSLGRARISHEGPGV